MTVTIVKKKKNDGDLLITFEFKSLFFSYYDIGINFLSLLVMTNIRREICRTHKVVLPSTYDILDFINK
jgi:hypothetical protein